MAPPPTKKAKTDPAVQISGDSLDQDFLLEDNFAPSDDSDNDNAGQDYDPAELVASDDEATATAEDPHRPLPQSDDEDDEPAPKKRKAGDDGEGATGGAEAGGEGKKKAKKEKKPKKPKAAKLQELGIGESEGLGLLPVAALVDALAEKQKRALPKLSNMEMDDLRLPGESSVPRSSLLVLAEADSRCADLARNLPRRYFLHHRTYQPPSLPSRRFPHPP